MLHEKGQIRPKWNKYNSKKRQENWNSLKLNFLQFLSLQYTILEQKNLSIFQFEGKNDV